MTMPRLLCHRPSASCCLVVLIGLTYLTGYLFYRNSKLKRESVELYADLDECRSEYSRLVLIKDEEIRLETEKYSTEWEQYSALLSRRQDRRNTHRNQSLDRDRIQICHDCSVYNGDGEPSDDYDCVPLRVAPPTLVCPYKDEEDGRVSGTIRRTGAWQEDYVRDFQHWLRKDDQIGLIDLGCYIGVYSMAAAVLDRRVLALDPSLENLKRLRRSLELARLDADVTTLNNAVSDVRGKAAVITHTYNKVMSEVRPLDRSSTPVSARRTEHFIDMILMNDLVSLWPYRNAIVRVDLNGFEHRAFSNADLLFRAVFIPVVIMNWEAMKAFYWLPLANRDRMLVEAMINFFLEMDYTPVSWDRHVLFVEIWDLWPADILWVHKTFQF